MSETFVAARGDIEYRVTTGTVKADTATLRRNHEQAMAGMSTATLKLTAAQERLDKALIRSKGVITNQVRSAEIALRKEMEATTTQVHRQRTEVDHAERSLSHLGRGAIAGSGIFRGLGRSMAFASAGFLGGTGFVYAIQRSIAVAKEFQTTQGQLQAAVETNGGSFDAYKGQIEDTLRAQEQLSGFTENDMTRSFIRAVRATGDVTEALRMNQAAAIIARGANIDLDASSLKLVRAFNGQTRGLTALGIAIPKGVKGWQAIDIAVAKYAGSLERYANDNGAEIAQNRFNLALHRTEVTIGTALLPAVTEYLTKAGDWLDNADNQRRIQDQTNTVVKDGSIVVHDLGAAFQFANKFIAPTTEALGGFENVAKDLVGLLLLKRLGLLAFGVRGVGTAAAVSTGEIAAMGTAATVASGKVALLSRLTLGINPYAIAAIAGVLGAQFLHNRFDEPNKITAAQLQDAATRKRIADAVGAEGLAKLDAAYGTGVAPAGPVGPTDATSALVGPIGPGTTKPGAAKKSTALPLDEQIALNIAEARSTGNMVALVAGLKAQIDFDNKYEAIQKGLLKTDVAHKGQHAKILERLYGDEASAQGELDSINEAAAVAKRAKNAAAAQAIRERARQYRAGLYTTETNLKTAVKAAKTPEGVARADDALIAFYKQEGADAKLTNPERARYRLAYEKTKAAEAKLLKDAQDKADRHAKKQHMDALRATGSRLRGAVYAATTVAGERRAESALVAFYRLSAKDKLVEVAMQKHYGELADRAQDKLDKQIEAADAKAEKARKKAAKTKHLTGLEIRENRLQNATARAELTDTLTDDRVRIQAEIAFYKAEAHDRTLSTLARIAYEKQQIEAEKKLKALDKQELATKASVAASVAEAFASFNSVQQRFAGNYQTASNGKLETHGYETVHELRGIRASVETANKRGRYPMSDYSGPAAWAAGS